MNICEIEGCVRQARSKSAPMCSLHYNRLKKFGTAGPAGLMRRENGSGNLDSYGYHRLTVDGQRVGMHRLVMEQYVGRPLLADESVHHRNGDRADNRIENLEIWSRYQPAGQRVEDKVHWALEILARYAPNHLATTDSLASREPRNNNTKAGI